MARKKAINIAHKKLASQLVRNRRGRIDAKENKAESSRNNSGAPKQPFKSFFIFTEDFRKSFKGEIPDNKASAISKAEGKKWSSMSKSEKAPYIEEAARRMDEYARAMEAFNEKQNGSGEEVTNPESEKSTSEIIVKAEEEPSARE